MKIELPHVGTIKLRAKALYRREGGYAVQFLEMDDATACRLEQALDQLQERATSDE